LSQPRATLGDDGNEDHSVYTRDARSRSQVLAGILLEDVERIAEHSVARVRELFPSYARLPDSETLPVTLANIRNLLEAIRDPDRDLDHEQRGYRASGEARGRQGIPSDEMLRAWLISLATVREAAYAVARARDWQGRATGVHRG
jgi:hypothetical protein